MLLGYNRLLVYFFLKIAPLEHGETPISLCANLYLPENSQPMFLIASKHEPNEASKHYGKELEGALKSKAEKIQ